jgi:hypothetical protein
MTTGLICFALGAASHYIASKLSGSAGPDDARLTAAKYEEARRLIAVFTKVLAELNFALTGRQQTDADLAELTKSVAEACGYNVTSVKIVRKDDGATKGDDHAN